MASCTRVGAGHTKPISSSSHSRSSQLTMRRPASLVSSPSSSSKSKLSTNSIKSRATHNNTTTTTNNNTNDSHVSVSYNITPQTSAHLRRAHSSTTTHSDNDNDSSIIPTQLASAVASVVLSTTIVLSGLNLHAAPAMADEESRLKAQALLEEISAKAGSSSVKPVTIAKKEEGKKMRVLISEDKPKPEKKKKRFKSEIAKEKKAAAPSTASSPKPDSKPFDLKSLIPVVGGLAVVGGGGFALTKLDIELPSIELPSFAALDSVIRFLDENMAKDVEVLGVGGETIIKTDDFKSGKTVSKTTKRKKK